MRAGDLWVTVKTKTTDKRTRAVKKRKVIFKATVEGTTMGSADACAIAVDDGNMLPLHAKVETRDGVSHLTCSGRTYYMIGQGMKNSGPHVLLKDHVVKMGACSLQVAEIRTHKPEDYQVDRIDPSKYTSEEDVPCCYVCFDSTSTPPNDLIHSPCVCRTAVHRNCLARWISTKGTRMCSICKTKLPIAMTVEPPYAVLQVVRHMRGLHWTGEREYIVSFGGQERRQLTIGSGTECDLSLPDPSLSRVHCRMLFEDGRFLVEDLQSSAGTFIRVMERHSLVTDIPAHFKMGRTLVTVTVRSNRPGMLEWSRGGGSDDEDE